MIFDHVFDVVIDDAFLWLPGFLPGSDVLAKLEGLNPAGSNRLKTAVSLVSAAESAGALSALQRIERTIIPGSRVAVVSRADRLTPGGVSR